jgi:pSer/pThr/pTyr-binding forkhead associated (FHA) protein
MAVPSFLVEAGKRRALLGGTELVIGRSGYCTMVLDEPSVSRVHASLKVVGDHVELRDLGSRNGTSVNGEPVGKSPTVVKPGDDIKVGHESVTLSVIDKPAFIVTQPNEDMDLGSEPLPDTDVSPIPTREMQVKGPGR